MIFSSDRRFISHRKSRQGREAKGQFRRVKVGRLLRQHFSLLYAHVGV